MKNKKVLSRVTFALSLCALLAVVFGIIPLVLASAPENGEVKTLTYENPLSDENEEHSSGVDSMQDENVEVAPIENTGEIEKPETGLHINAISKEHAAEIVIHEISNDFIYVVETELPDGGIEIESGTLIFFDAIYKDSNDLFNDPVWFVLIVKHTKQDWFCHRCEDVTFQEILTEWTFNALKPGEQKIIPRIGWRYLEENLDESIKINTHNRGYYIEKKNSTDREMRMIHSEYISFTTDYIAAEVNALTGELLSVELLERKPLNY